MTRRDTQSDQPRMSALMALALVLLAILGCRGGISSTKLPSWTKAKVLSDKEDHPSKIVTDGDAIYYVTGGTVASMNQGTNNIKRISLKDGSVSIIVKGGNQVPNEMLFVNQKYLYWSDGGNIFRVTKDGGESEKLIPNAARPDEIVMDNENFYWLMWTGEGMPPQPIMYASKRGGKRKS